MPEEARVSVVIPVWNLWEMTSACLRSLAEHTVGEVIEVVVADNASTDATARELEPLGRDLFGPAFKVVRMPENLGFAKACNAGARAATGELLFFLNNDTTMTAGWLPPLRAAMADARVGAVGPLLLYPNNTVQHCGVYVSPFFSVGHLYEDAPATFAAAYRRHPLQAITGAAILLRKKDFMDCGGFYEGYCNGWEDVDLCCALRARGLKLSVESASVVYHHTSQTPGRFAQEAANRDLLRQRFGTQLRPDAHMLVALDGYGLCIGPNLHSWYTLSEEKERQLAQEFSGANFDEDLCRVRLEQEPFWYKGCVLLAKHLEKTGRKQDSLSLLLTLMHTTPDTEVIAATLQLARRMGIQRAVAAELETILKPEDHAENKRKVQLCRKAAYDCGDKVLAGLLSDWLQRYAAA